MGGGHSRTTCNGPHRTLYHTPRRTAHSTERLRGVNPRALACSRRVASSSDSVEVPAVSASPSTSSLSSTSMPFERAVQDVRNSRNFWHLDERRQVGDREQSAGFEELVRGMTRAPQSAACPSSTWESGPASWELVSPQVPAGDLSK